MQKVRTGLIQLVIVVLLLLLIECLCWLWNSYRTKAQPFLLDTTLVMPKNHDQLAGYGYRMVDPLLGWGLTEDAVYKAGYTLESNTVTVSSKLPCDTPFVIWITGGSTSDIVLNNENWPLLLLRMFEDSGYCCKLYVAATGGYSSGQELLKTLRDCPGKVDLCISYSGANEHISPTYVSRQERTFYRKAFTGRQPTMLLPNTVYAIRNLLSNDTQLELLTETPAPPADFWINNMQNMQAVATGNHTQFIGVLQPLAGTSAYTQNNIPSKFTNYINKNKTIYPAMQAFADTTPYMVNLTTLFDTATGDVYVDDCHINKPYQQMVAKAVYQSVLPRVAGSGKK